MKRFFRCVPHHLFCGQSFSGDEAAVLDNADTSLAYACNQLGLDPAQMKDAFTSSLSVLKGIVFIMYSCELFLPLLIKLR